MIFSFVLNDTEFSKNRFTDKKSTLKVLLVGQAKQYKLLSGPR